MPDPTVATRFGRRPRRWALAAVVVAVAVASVFLFVHRPPVLREEPVVDLARLVRQDGLLVWRDETNRVFTGWVVENYAEGRPKSRGHVVEGRNHGMSEGWHPNGILRIQEHFAGGVSEGLVTRWNPDGSKVSEGVSRAGKFEGIFRRWHPNGVLAEELEMSGGQPHGLSRAWYPSGNPKAEARMEQGRVVERKFWPDQSTAQLAAQPAEGGKS